MNDDPTPEGYSIGPSDDRDKEDPEWTIDPILSSTNTGFGGPDPAADEASIEEVPFRA
jgi:hypothetical protein